MAITPIHSPPSLSSKKELPVSHFIKKREEIEKVFRDSAFPSQLKTQCRNFIRKHYLGLNLLARLDEKSYSGNLASASTPAGSIQINVAPQGPVSVVVPTEFQFAKYRTLVKELLTYEFPSGNVTRTTEPASNRLGFFRLSFQHLIKRFKAEAKTYGMPPETQQKIADFIAEHAPNFLSHPEVHASGQKFSIDSYFVTFNRDSTIYIQLDLRRKKGAFKQIYKCWDFFRAKPTAALLCYQSKVDTWMELYDVKTLSPELIKKEIWLMRKYSKTPGFPKLFTVEQYPSFQEWIIDESGKRVENEVDPIIFYQPLYDGDLNYLIGIPYSKDKTIIRNLTAALSVLEQDELIHHDVKFDNGLFKWPKYGFIKTVITDLGLAIHKTEVSPTRLRGTGRWNAPEYAVESNKKERDLRTVAGPKYDAWGLGLILLYLWRPVKEAEQRAGWVLQGVKWEHADGAQNSLEIITKIAQYPEKYQKILPPPLPENASAVDRVIEKLLQIDPAKRATANEALHFLTNQDEESKENEHVSLPLS